MTTAYKHFRLQLIILGKLNLGVVKMTNDYRLQPFNSPMNSKSPLPAQTESVIFNITINQNVWGSWSHLNISTPTLSDLKWNQYIHRISSTQVPLSGWWQFRLNWNDFRQPLKCSPFLHRHHIIRSYKVKYHRTESTETFNYLCTTLFTLSFHIEITNLKLQTAIMHSVDVTWLLGIINVLCWNKSYAMVCILLKYTIATHSEQ